MSAVLIVDDSPADRALFRTILTRAGYSVHESARGRDALDRVREVRPHVIVLDVNLPDLDGRAVCRALKAEPETGAVPVLMLTVRDNDADVLAGLEAGADDYVAKDADPEIILARVRRLIQFRQLATVAVLNEHLVQVGRLLAGIVHEIRGPLSVIRGSAELMRLQLQADDPCHQWVDPILRSAQLLQVRLEHLMATVRSGPSVLDAFDVCPLVRESADLFLKGTDPRGNQITIHADCIGGLPYVRGDAGRLIQVLLALFGNAHEAFVQSRVGGRVTVRGGTAQDDGREWVTLDVSDDGPGIPEDFLDRIFEPFFTTKEKGSGYGLYLASEILKEQQGRLTVCNLTESRGRMLHGLASPGGLANPRGCRSFVKTATRMRNDAPPMSDQRRRPCPCLALVPRPALALAAYLLTWAAVTASAIALFGREAGAWLVLAAFLAHGSTVLVAVRLIHTGCLDPIGRLATQIERVAQNPADALLTTERATATEPLVRALGKLFESCKRQAVAAQAAFTRPGDSGTFPRASLPRTGLLDTPSDHLDLYDPQVSTDFSTTDMVNRLEPRLLRWLESSPAEQDFLGWDLRQLREKSFLEIVHPDDLARVKEQLRTALVKGEVHGLILRIRTAHGKQRAIEINVGARYASDLTVSHLRCHISDVTAKVRSERELRLRTRELTQVNEQLRLINRELEELKDRYRDLYQNAPAMYFSLDDQGRFLECNDTMILTTGCRREALIGQSYEIVLPEHVRPLFRERFAKFLEAGSVEISTQWIKASGEVIDIWVTGTAVRDGSGRIIHSRSVAQDVTARNRLEAELQEKNARLATTIDELSRRNKEMDEFTYVVSHDLQEPLRTLTAFSDFLLRDYHDRLDAEGQEFVRYIVEASRRMRALIQDLLSLSRAGKVTAEFFEVNLEEVIGIVRADLAELVRSRHAEVRVLGILPTVWGDGPRLRQLLANLISNGLKYNDKAAPIVEIGTRNDGDGHDDEWTTLFVRDNGIGIDPQFHSRIFQLFRRLHTREEYEGTGAGLAICEKIVHAHGGRIWVESAPDRGASFFVTLRHAPEELAETGASAPTVVPHAT